MNAPLRFICQKKKEGHHNRCAKLPLAAERARHLSLSLCQVDQLTTEKNKST